jgi:hypothetical protein
MRLIFVVTIGSPYLVGNLGDYTLWIVAVNAE